MFRCIFNLFYYWPQKTGSGFREKPESGSATLCQLCYSNYNKYLEGELVLLVRVIIVDGRHLLQIVLHKQTTSLETEIWYFPDLDFPTKIWIFPYRNRNTELTKNVRIFNPQKIVSKLSEI